MSRQEKLEARGTTFQHKLWKEIDLKLLRRIPEGTMVWLERGGRGMTQHDVLVKKIGGKVRSLTGFELLNPLTLYLDGNHWTLSTGMRIGTYSRNAKRVKK